MKNQIINNYLSKKRKKNLRVFLEGAVIFGIGVFLFLLGMGLTAIIIIKTNSM